MARGGRRSGAPGRSYANRADLTAAPKPLPKTAVTGQPYGAAGEQMAAQSVVPMGNAPITPGAGSPPTQPPGVSPAGGPTLPGLPPGTPPPGSLPPLTAPTDRPDEHLMTGVAQGPGAGPEALTPLIQHPLVDGVAQLNALGGSVSPQIKALRDAINAQLANQTTP